LLFHVAVRELLLLLLLLLLWLFEEALATRKRSNHSPQNKWFEANVSGCSFQVPNFKKARARVLAALTLFLRCSAAFSRFAQSTASRLQRSDTNTGRRNHSQQTVGLL